MFNYDVLTAGQVRRKLIFRCLIALCLAVVTFASGWFSLSQEDFVGGAGGYGSVVTSFIFVMCMASMIFAFAALDLLLLRSLFVRHDTEFNRRIFDMHNSVRGKACEGEYHRYLRKVIYTRDGLLLTRQELRRLESDLNDYLVRQDISTLEASSVTLGNKVV